MYTHYFFGLNPVVWSPSIPRPGVQLHLWWVLWPCFSIVVMAPVMEFFLMGVAPVIIHFDTISPKKTVQLLGYPIYGNHHIPTLGSIHRKFRSNTSEFFRTNVRMSAVSTGWLSLFVPRSYKLVYNTLWLFNIAMENGP